MTPGLVAGIARSRSTWRSVVILAIGATVTATSLSFGRRPGGFRCIKPQWISAVGLAATSPGFGAGDGILTPTRKPASYRHTRRKREEATGTSFRD